MKHKKGWLLSKFLNNHGRMGKNIQVNNYSIAVGCSKSCIFYCILVAQLTDLI